MNDNSYFNPIVCLECHLWFYPNGSGPVCEYCKMKKISKGDWNGYNT